ncbi:MAG: S8 family serine peptidase [Acidimicrobiia bacterium]|nr:S8 family serine peptidase [Acidimicrobiia bacterium]
MHRTRRARAGLRALAVAAVLAATALPADATSAPTGPGVPLVAVERDEDGGLSVRTETVRSYGEALAFVADVGHDLVDLSVDGTATALDVGARPAVTGGDPKRGWQWALDRASFEAAWSRTRGDGVVVAVLDTEVRSDHEDLDAQLVTGRDMSGGGSDGVPGGARPDPDHYHGTHVAGIVAAEAGNGVGVHGGAPAVKIMPVRVLYASGGGGASGPWSHVAAGIIWATDHGADVVNMSLGGLAGSSAVLTAIEYARDHGVVVVASAGNAGDEGNPTTYPAAYPGVVAVAATENPAHHGGLDRTAGFSNHGPYVDLAAPGVGILAPYPSSRSAYATLSGTSMAAPYVSAAAALVKAVRPAATPDEVESILTGTADDAGAAGRDDHFGHGIVGPSAAVEAAAPAPPAPPAPPPPTLRASQGVIGPTGPVTVRDGVLTPIPHGTPGGVPIVAAAETPSRAGSWTASPWGAIYTFGDAPFLGSLGGLTLSAWINGMAATPSGMGYWLVAWDGGIFAFGDAPFHGSTGDLVLNQPIVGMAATPSNQGYWLVASDGGIFAFGDARFFGSTGDVPLNEPITAMASTPSGQGYWLVARDGGIFAFGDARFFGSTGAMSVGSDITGMVSSPTGQGYWLLTADGRVFAFGDAA